VGPLGNPRDGASEPAAWSQEDGTAVGSDPPQKVSPPGMAVPARGLVRFLYSSNPFYILSADLIFVGLRISFGGGSAARTWALLLGLGGYALLLATAACILIRLGNLWDDLRSMLILIVMMFLAMAMSGDDVMAADPRNWFRPAGPRWRRRGSCSGLSPGVAMTPCVPWSRPDY
jgi:hypothetical protein